MVLGRVDRTDDQYLKHDRSIQRSKMLHKMQAYESAGPKRCSFDRCSTVMVAIMSKHITAARAAVY